MQTDLQVQLQQVLQHPKQIREIPKVIQKSVLGDNYLLDINADYVGRAIIAALLDRDTNQLLTAIAGFDVSELLGMIQDPDNS